MSQKKFEEIKKANQAAAKKLVQEHVSSSSEEEGDEDFEGKQGKIVANTFVTYTTQTGTEPLNVDVGDVCLFLTLFHSSLTPCEIVFASQERACGHDNRVGVFCILLFEFRVVQY